MLDMGKIYLFIFLKKKIVIIDHFQNMKEDNYK